MDNGNADKSKYAKVADCRNESYLEKSLREKNVAAMYNVVYSGFLVMAILNTMNDYFYNGGSQYGFGVLITGFEHYQILFFVPVALSCLHCLVFYYWKLRVKFKGVALVPNVEWKHAWALIAFVQFFLLFNILGIYCVKNKVSMLTRVVLIRHQMFLSFKGYGFVRTNMILLEERKKDYKLPAFSHFLYFTFVPTFVYKEQYLRSTVKRSWWKVSKYAFEVFAELYMFGLFRTMYIEKEVEGFGLRPFNAFDVVYKCWTLALPMNFCMMLLQALFIDSLPSFYAEIFQFGERQWHTDWWTSSNMGIFYTKWNSLVQDGLHAYVYKDVHDRLTANNKTVAKFAALAFSMLVHELASLYIFETITLIFVGSMLHSMTQLAHPTTGRFYNFIILFQMYIGLGLVIGMHFLEMQAKKNCANSTENILYLPRLWYCENN